MPESSLEQSQESRRRVLEHKVQLCLLGLAEFRDYWPFVDWMYRLFSKLLDRLRVSDDSNAVHGNNLPENARPEREALVSSQIVPDTAAAAQQSGATMSLPPLGLESILAAGSEDDSLGETTSCMTFRYLRTS